MLTDWINDTCAELGITGLDEAGQQIVLDLARDVAHGVARPAAPLTSFLLGVAVGRGADLETAAATIGRLAESWQPAA